LLNIQGWYIVGQKAESISDGTIDGQLNDQTKPPKLLPMVPKAFVIMRNVQITADDWGEAGAALQAAQQNSQSSGQSSTSAMGFSAHYLFASASANVRIRIPAALSATARRAQPGFCGLGPNRRHPLYQRLADHRLDRRNSTEGPADRRSDLGVVELLVEFQFECRCEHRFHDVPAGPKLIAVTGRTATGRFQLAMESNADELQTLGQEFLNALLGAYGTNAVGGSIVFLPWAWRCPTSLA
jgi:hypothetical protein